VAASSRKGNRMTGNFEQPKHTGASAAWPEASTSLVKVDDILTPRSLPLIRFLCAHQGVRAPGLKVPDSWVYEKTRGRNPIPCLRLGRYVRFNWVPPASPTSGNMADRPGATGQISGMSEASQTPERVAPGPAKTGLILKRRAAHPRESGRPNRVAWTPGHDPSQTLRRSADIRSM